jgi:hypothetical protein
MSLSHTSFWEERSVVILHMTFRCLCCNHLLVYTLNEIYLATEISDIPRDLLISATIVMIKHDILNRQASDRIQVPITSILTHRQQLFSGQMPA